MHQNGGVLFIHCVEIFRMECIEHIEVFWANV